MQNKGYIFSQHHQWALEFNASPCTGVCPALTGPTFFNLIFVGNLPFSSVTAIPPVIMNSRRAIYDNELGQPSLCPAQLLYDLWVISHRWQ